jgi:hypothetical protein
VKTPVEKVLEAVDRYEKRHNGFWCICPAHDDPRIRACTSRRLRTAAPSSFAAPGAINKGS